MSGNQQPLVTVLTPVYNGADYLGECIESVLKQTYQNFEYIIVNNCSTDGTLQVAREYAARDSRIRVHDNEKFVGVIENHNNAFRMVSPDAKYCKVVSGDDFIFPNCIEKMVQFAEANPSVGFVGAYQLSGKYVKWQGFPFPQTVFNGVELCRRVIGQRQAFVDGQPVFGFGTPTSLLYRADLVRESSAFYPNPSPHSDTSACFRYLDRCDFGFIYEILSFERTHELTQTSRSVQMHRHISAYLSDLISYGAKYLNEDELSYEIHNLVRDYYRILAASLIESRGKDFWDYHKGRLKELGYPLTRWALFKAFMAVSLKELLNPEQAVRRIRRRVSPKVSSEDPQSNITELSAAAAHASKRQ